MEIRPVRADEWQELRALRLRALADAPDAFGDTLAAARARPDDVWRERTARNAAGEEDITLVAVGTAGWHAMVSAYRPAGEREVVTFVGLWVEPAHRGTGLGTALFRALYGWAARGGATRVQLWVTETNTHARALYAREGFVATGQRRPLASDPRLTTIHMVRPLGRA